MSGNHRSCLSALYTTASFPINTLVRRLCADPTADITDVCLLNAVQGNTHAKGWHHNDAVPHDDAFQNSESPADPPGSPLTYSPQLLMQPHDAAGGSPYGSRGAGSAVSDCHAVAGWPAQPKLVPTVIVCESPLLLRHTPV